MVLEACMICIDNSEYMRNGDYSPTRLQAQNETVNYLTNSKIEGNQESEVGFLSMAGRRIEVHNSLSRSVGDIMTSLKERVKIQGQCDFMSGLKIAQLGLKNRQNKNQQQRIIMFVGSPIEVKQKELVMLGKKFKKNNIAVDVINFGAENALNENTEKLEAFIAAVNSSDNSHLVSIPPGPHILSDLVLSSAIMGEAAVPAGSMGGGANAEVDANEDPELAMVLRMSMEEERQRQERLTADKAKEEGGATAADATPATPAAATPAAASTTAATPAAPTKAADTAEAMEDDVDEDDEDAMLAAAIAMSMAEGQENPNDAEGDDADVAAVLTDRNFINSLLESVPGVENDDIALDDILNNLGGDDDDDDEEEAS